MSKARDLFFSIPGLVRPGDTTAFETLEEAAREWRMFGRHFSAGHCTFVAMRAAWGTDRVNDVLAQAIEDYRNSVKSEPPESLESFAAIVQWIAALRYFEPSSTQAVVRSLMEELAQRLITYYGSAQKAHSYLVKGILATTDLDGYWEPSFPEFETSGGVFESSLDGRLAMTIPSAFQLLVRLSDYRGAQGVIELCPEGFNTPGLRGWKAAVRGFLTPGEAVELFTAAANAFAEDNYDPRSLRPWTSINVDLWSKYFRARAAVARISNEHAGARECVREASRELEGTQLGWVNPHVSRFRILVNTLLQLFDQGQGFTPDQARHELELQVRISGGSDADESILRFIDTSAQAFRQVRTDPSLALTTGDLHFALEALGRIPLIDPAVATALAPAIGRAAYVESLGPQCTWIYRTLEAISDEAYLRKIVLRLAQASLPLYAQIRHGPIEYGKDVVALLEIDGRRMLRMWQVKCGDISMPKWNVSRDELEQIFLVPLSDLQIGAEISSREGVLVCNGHANSYVEPVMNGWFAEQKRVYHREYQFMHLDRIVQWIAHDRLINAFRAVLDELGIEPVVGGPL